MTDTSPESDPIIAAMDWPPEMEAMAMASLAWLRACHDSVHYQPDKGVAARRAIVPPTIPVTVSPATRPHPRSAP